MLDARTGKNGTDLSQQASAKTDKSKSGNISKNDFNRKDALNNSRKVDDKNVSDVDDTDENEPEDDKNVDNTEAVMDVLMTAALQIADAVTESFDLAPDELQNILDDMGVDMTDLLDTQILQEVLLEAGGAGDSLELLTDENLYNNFNDVMAKLNEVLDSDSKIAKMTVADLKDAFDAANAADTADTLKTVSDDALPQAIALQTDRQQDDAVKDFEVDTDNVDADTTGSSVMIERSDRSKENSEEQAKNSDDKHSDDNGRFTGSFVQNLQDNNATAVQGTEAENMSGSEVNTRDIMEQIMDYMKVQVKADTSNLEMQLHPASLGTLRIQLASNGGAVTANFITQNEAVKAALESQMVQLKESFAEQGIKVEAIEVTVQTHQFEQNLEQNQSGQNSGSEPHSRGTRRIRLEGGIFSEEELEELDEDDRLAAEMMAANGGTVDYTA
jgi:flagellar hook-length control protein FliK